LSLVFVLLEGKSQEKPSPTPHMQSNQLHDVSASEAPELFQILFHSLSYQADLVSIELRIVLSS